MPALSWKTVAKKLAAQLEVHDFCDNHARIDVGLAEGCPFCQDRAALLRYREGAPTAKSASDWEKLARIVAARMEYQDYCENRHEIKAGLALHCPFCEDRQAIADFRRKDHQTDTFLQRTTAGMTEVPIQDVPRREHFGSTR